MSRPATAKASKNYSCSCGCGEKINIGHPVIVHMGDFYSPGHFHPERQLDLQPISQRQFIHGREIEPEQCKLQLF